MNGNLNSRRATSRRARLSVAALVPVEGMVAGVAGRICRTGKIKCTVTVIPEAGIVLPGLALAQRIGVGGGELAPGVVGRGAAAGRDVDAAHRHRGLVAEGVVDGVGLGPQRRRAGLDHLLGQQPRRAVVLNQPLLSRYGVVRIAFDNDLHALIFALLQTNVDPIWY